MCEEENINKKVVAHGHIHARTLLKSSPHKKVDIV